MCVMFFVMTNCVLFQMCVIIFAMTHYVLFQMWSNPRVRTQVSLKVFIMPSFSMYTLNLDFPGHLLRPLSPSSSPAALSKDEQTCDGNIYVTKILTIQIQGSSNIYKYNNLNLTSCPSHHPSILALALKAELSLSILRTSHHLSVAIHMF